MRDLRHRVVGLTLLTAGLALLTISSGRLRAYPNDPTLPDCNGYDVSTKMQPCKDSVIVCNGQGQTACVTLSTDPPFAYHVETFPDSCVEMANKSCNKALSNCYRKTLCVWSEDKATPANSKCVEAQGVTGEWVSVSKPTGTPCATPNTN